MESSRLRPWHLRMCTADTGYLTIWMGRGGEGRGGGVGGAERKGEKKKKGPPAKEREIDKTGQLNFDEASGPSLNT